MQQKSYENTQSYQVQIVMLFQHQIVESCIKAQEMCSS